MRQCLFLIMVLFFSFNSALPQTGNLVPDDGVTGELHKTHIGQILFMQQTVPPEQLKTSDLLTRFVLKDSCDLNIRVFMSRSLTNSLHLLAPEMTAEELTKNGNYQFTFLVDQKMVYRENLNPRAGTAAGKNKMTMFRVPLLSTTNEDSWGRFLWNRFMLSGGEDALTEGIHTLKIEIRSYLKKENIITGELIAEGQLKLAIIRTKLTEKQLDVQSIAPNSGWTVNASVINKIKIRQLNKNILQNRFKNITSIIIIKNGKLALEEYFNGANRYTLHDTRSVGKSFTPALMGMAIQDGYIKNEYQQLREFYPLQQYDNHSAKKDSVTIKDLLTMSSAFMGSDADEQSPGNEENMYPANDWVKFALNLPMDSAKQNGKQWDYFTAGVVLLGDILHKSVPGGLENYAAKKLFQPLGINRYQWEYTPQKVANTAGGLRMSSLNLARFGQLYQNDGLWNGQQLISKEWVQATLSRHLAIPEREHEFYGYLFWNKTFTVNGKPYEAFYCTGNGGSKIYVFKNLPLTVVITATAYNKPYAHLQVDQIMNRHILPSVVGKD